MVKKIKFKIGETVKIISGIFSGKNGKIVKINRKKRTVCLEEFFREKFVKKNSDKRKENIDGQRKEIVLIPIDISNLKSLFIK